MKSILNHCKWKKISINNWKQFKKDNNKMHFEILRTSSHSLKSSIKEQKIKTNYIIKLFKEQFHGFRHLRKVQYAHITCSEEKGMNATDLYSQKFQSHLDVHQVTTIKPIYGTF